jgi:CRISPR-associated protein Csb1
MSGISADRLIAGCSDDSAEAGITIRTELVPLAGEGTAVKPATYAGGVFQYGRRWWGEGEDRKVVPTISLDNVPSQANRLEAALAGMARELGLPELVLDLTSLEPLPPHVPRQLSSFMFPHRNADAYLRDSEVGGEDFLKSDLGKAIFDATGDNADALLEWFPQSLLFGFWQSHLGKKRSQAKLARAWVSEIVGIDPATGADPGNATRTEALKGDALNLITEGNKVDFDPDDTATWEIAEPGAKSKLGKLEDLAEIGHGQVPVSADKRTLSGVSFRQIVQQATVSFASIRKIRCSEANAEARAYVAALGLLAHTGAFGRSFNLRSGCDLRPRQVTWTWLGADGDEEVEALTVDEAKALYQGVRDRGIEAGLPLLPKDGPVGLQPKAKLAKVIRNTFPAPVTE